MPSYVIHIGPHKTGTTYLQSSFARLRQSLLERGVLYPSVWEMPGGPPGHVLLGQYLRAGDHAALRRGFAALNAAPQHTVLLSAEALSALDREAIATLHGLLEGAPATIVFHCRRWSELLPSSWQEQVKQGHAMTLPEFAARQLRDVSASSLLNFDLKLSAFAAFFGRPQLRLAPFSTLRDRKIDIFRHFAANFLAWPDAPTPLANATVNVSRGLAEIEFLRAFNALGPVAPGERGAYQRPKLAGAELAAKAPKLFSAMRSHEKILRLDDDAPQFSALHQALFDTYTANLAPPRLEDGLFRPKRASITYIGTDYMLEPGIVDSLHHLRATLP